MFQAKRLLKIFTEFTERNLCRSLFFNPADILLPYAVFIMIFAKKRFRFLVLIIYILSLQEREIG